MLNNCVSGPANNDVCRSGNKATSAMTCKAQSRPCAPSRLCAPRDASELDFTGVARCNNICVASSSDCWYSASRLASRPRSQSSSARLRSFCSAMGRTSGVGSGRGAYGSNRRQWPSEYASPAGLAARVNLDAAATIAANLSGASSNTATCVNAVQTNTAQGRSRISARRHSDAARTCKTSELRRKAVI